MQQKRTELARWLSNAGYETIAPMDFYVDCSLYDIKALNPKLHRTGTGAGNALILENRDRLLRTGKAVIIRTPVVPGYNEGEEMERISRYCTERLLPHEKLPYHSIGESKKAALCAQG